MVHPSTPPVRQEIGGKARSVMHRTYRMLHISIRIVCTSKLSIRYTVYPTLMRMILPSFFGAVEKKRVSLTLLVVCNLCGRLSQRLRVRFGAWLSFWCNGIVLRGTLVRSLLGLFLCLRHRAPSSMEMSRQNRSWHTCFRSKVCGVCFNWLPAGFGGCATWQTILEGAFLCFSGIRDEGKRSFFFYPSLFRFFSPDLCCATSSVFPGTWVLVVLDIELETSSMRYDTEKQGTQSILRFRCEMLRSSHTADRS